jgi:hypothetical protein
LAKRPSSSRVDLIESLQDALKYCARTKLLSPLSNDEIKGLEISIGKLPQEFKKLLKLTRGIELGDARSIRFDIPVGGNDNLFLDALLLGTDDYGDYAVLDFSNNKNGIGKVIYYCHDPARVMISAKNLDEFFRAVLPDSHRSNDRFLLSKDGEKKLFDLDVKTGNLEGEASFLNQRSFLNWKASLPPSAKIYFLDNAEMGDGFNWAQFGSNSSLERFKNKLIFSVYLERKKQQQERVGVVTETNSVLLTQVKNINFPCVWFSGPFKSGRTKFGCGVIDRKWIIYFTPFWPTIERYLPGGLLDSDGKLYQFKELKGWWPQPKFLPSLLGGLGFYMSRIAMKFDILSDLPLKLNRVEFKEKIIEISIGKKQFESSRLNKDNLAVQKLNDSVEYRELIEWVRWYQKTDGGTVI